MEGEDLETPTRIISPDGTVSVHGCVVPGIIHYVQNVTADILPAGTVVRYHADSTVGRWDVGATGRLKDNRLKCQIAEISVGPGGYRPIIGVAIEDIVPGSKGRVAGLDSVVMTRCAAGFEGNFGYAILVLTPGVCDIDPVRNEDNTVGRVVIPSGTGASHSGSNTMVGVQVHPY